MQLLLDILAHPSRWRDVQDLSPETRLFIALFLVLAALLVGWIGGVLVPRWAARRPSLEA